MELPTPGPNDILRLRLGFGRARAGLVEAAQELRLVRLLGHGLDLRIELNSSYRQ